MSVLDAPLVHSPPDIQLSSPPDLASEFVNDPYTSSTSFISQAPPPNFQLTLPPSKTPRIPAHISPYIGADGEIDLNDGGATYTSSPNRRGGRQYPSIHQNLVLPTGYTTTPKNMSIGISQSTDPTPSRFGNMYSSPADNSPLHASMRYAGEDSIAGQWELNDESRMMGQGTTPTGSPSAARKGKRTLSGLGESPMRTVKRSRFASMGTGSPYSSVPPSPSRAATLPNQQERSASLAAPAFSTQSRAVSGMSMVSSASTELISPNLMPYEGGYDMMGGFPTSMSAPADLSAAASFEESTSPTIQFHPPTVSPHDLLPSGGSYRSGPPSVYPSPVIDNAAPPAGKSPSLSSTHGPYYLPERSQALDTIHEGEQAGDAVPMSAQTMPTPTMPMMSAPPSTGAPAHAMLPDQKGQYPIPYSAYPSPAMQSAEYPVSATYGSAPTPPLDLQQTPHLASSTPPTYWTGTLGSGQHLGQGYPQTRAMQQAGYMHPPGYYPAHIAPPHQYPPPAPHTYMNRAVSASNTFGYPAHSYSPYHQVGHSPSFPHSSLTRSVSTPFIPSMPPPVSSGGSTPSVYAVPQAPASAPMASSVSLPTAAESAMYLNDPNWVTGSSGGVGLGLGTEQPQNYTWDSATQYEPSVSVKSTPTTPSRRKRHPSIGNRLRPGPKPRLTPKKRGPSGSSPIMNDGEGTEGPASTFPSPDLGAALPPSQYYVPRSRYHTAAGAGPSAAGPSEPKNLELGGPLGPPVHEAYEYESQHDDHPYHPYPPPHLHAHVQPRAGSSYSAPQLHLEHAPRPHSPEGMQVAGVPTDIIEGMYVTFMSTEGSSTGQPAKRFRCLIETCEREFPRKSAIKSHIQTHLDDKPFICAIKDCGASFVRQHDLKRHMKIHTGHKPFPCPCGKIFARGDALRRHRERKLNPQCYVDDGERD